MVPGAQDGPALLIGQKAAEGQPPGDALGEGHHVGLDAELLIGEEGAGAAHAGLDLVDEEEPVLVRAELRHRLDVVRVQGIHAALPLDQLHHHRAHVVPGGGLEARHVVGVGVAEALGEGEEKLVEVVLAGGLQGGDGPAVEGIV